MEFLDRLAHLIPPPRVHRHTYAGVFAPHSSLRPLVVLSSGPDPALTIRLQQAAEHMGLKEELVEQFVMSVDPQCQPADQPGTINQQHPLLEPETQKTETQKASLVVLQSSLFEQQPPSQHWLTSTDHSSVPPSTKTQPNKKARRARRASIMWAMLMSRIFEIEPLTCPVCSNPLKIISFINETQVIEQILSHLGLPVTPPPISPARGHLIHCFPSLNPIPMLTALTLILGSTLTNLTVDNQLPTTANG